MLSSQCQDQFNSLAQLQVKRKNFHNIFALCYFGVMTGWIDELYIMICCYGNMLPSEWKRAFHHYLMDNGWNSKGCKYKRFPFTRQYAGSMRQARKTALRYSVWDQSLMTSGNKGISLPRLMALVSAEILQPVTGHCVRIATCPFSLNFGTGFSTGKAE